MEDNQTIRNLGFTALVFVLITLALIVIAHAFI